MVIVFLTPLQVCQWFSYLPVPRRIDCVNDADVRIVADINHLVGAVLDQERGVVIQSEEIGTTANKQLFFFREFGQTGFVETLAPAFFANLKNVQFHTHQDGYLSCRWAVQLSTNPRFHDVRVIARTENGIGEPSEHELVGTLGCLDIGRRLVFRLEPVIVQRDANFT